MSLLTSRLAARCSGGLRRIAHNSKSFKSTHRSPSSFYALSSRLCQSSNTDKRTQDYFYGYRANELNKLRTSTDFDPTDTVKVFQSFNTFELIKYNTLFSLLSSNVLVNTMTLFMNKMINHSSPTVHTIANDEQQKQEQEQQTITTTKRSKIPKLTFNDLPLASTATAIFGILGNILSKPIFYIVRKHYFPLFTGGETIEECVQMASKYYKNNIRLIIDNSTEEGDSMEVFEHNMATKKQLVDISHEYLKKSVEFMAIKMTSLCSPSLLEYLTDILNKENPENGDPTPYINDGEKLQELESTLNILTELCEYAKMKNIGVWLDAEQYSRQPGMNYLSRCLQQRINHFNDNKVWLYQTYQCYLQDSADWIKFDVEHSRANGYNLGVKLVRGAYLEYEAEKARVEKRPNPIYNSKTQTDQNYDGMTDYVLSTIMDNRINGDNNVGVAICTHNRESLINATKTMNKLGIARDEENVYQAQLNGMCDNLTYGLGYSGYNALKLIPYGAFDDVLPFLMRRFDENKEIMNGTQRERELYKVEIKRRLFGY